jgi:hypothetical protein
MRILKDGLNLLLNVVLLLSLGVTGLWVRSHRHWDALFYSSSSADFRLDSAEQRLTIFMFEGKDESRSTISGELFVDHWLGPCNRPGSRFAGPKPQPIRFGLEYAAKTRIFSNRGSSVPRSGRCLVIPQAELVMAMLPLVFLNALVGCFRYRKWWYSRKSARTPWLSVFKGIVAWWTLRASLLICTCTVLIGVRSFFRRDEIGIDGDPTRMVEISRGDIVSCVTPVPVTPPRFWYEFGAVSIPWLVSPRNQFLGFGFDILPATQNLPEQRVWRIPLWPAVFLSAAFPTWVWLRRRRQRLAKRWVERGLCVACGYDLRASPDRCPECGRLSSTEPLGR